MGLLPKKKDQFKKTVWDHYHASKRDQLPWRKKITPYRIWISEVMLQQTQVDRVVGFFEAWMKKFPSVKDLANASQIDVLKYWKGLGYNSRALRLKKAAEMIVKNYKGAFPKTYEEILELPGIGPYTAGAITAFAYNLPTTMIETNIRRAYLYHFFRDKENIHDRELLQVIDKTKDQENSREWYWALMDYGSHLGKTIPNPNKKSRHYTVQKHFKGSNREIRGTILSLLLAKKKVSFGQLFENLKDLSTDHDRVEQIVSALEEEGFVKVSRDTISLKK